MGVLRCLKRVSTNMWVITRTLTFDDECAKIVMLVYSAVPSCIVRFGCTFSSSRSFLYREVVQPKGEIVLSRSLEVPDFRIVLLAPSRGRLGTANEVMRVSRPRLRPELAA
jgi:hypothetical protein